MTFSFVFHIAEAVPVKPVVNPFAIERPHAAAHLLERQGSFRGLSQLNQSSPFKRQMSLRIGDLPSTVQRQQNSLSNEAPSYKSNLLITTPGTSVCLTPHLRQNGPIPVAILPSVDCAWVGCTWNWVAVVGFQPELPSVDPVCFLRTRSLMEMGRFRPGLTWKCGVCHLWIPLGSSAFDLQQKRSNSGWGGPGSAELTIRRFHLALPHLKSDGIGWIIVGESAELPSVDSVWFLRLRFLMETTRFRPELTLKCGICHQWIPLGSCALEISRNRPISIEDRVRNRRPWIQSCSCALDLYRKWSNSGWGGPGSAELTIRSFHLALPHLNHAESNHFHHPISSNFISVLFNLSMKLNSAGSFFFISLSILSSLTVLLVNNGC